MFAQGSIVRLPCSVPMATNVSHRGAVGFNQLTYNRTGRWHTLASQFTSYRTATKLAGSSRLLALQDIGRSAEEPPNWNCLWRHNGAARVRARSGPSTVVAKHQANSSSGRTNSCCFVLACPYHYHHPAGDRGTAHRTMRLFPGSRCTVCRSSAALPHGGNNWHRYRVCC